MSLCRCNFYSHVLLSCVNIHVLIPDSPRSQSGMSLDDRYPVGNRYKTLYLLHGMYEDDSVWIRRTNIERYAAKYNLVVVMPAAQNSYYTDMNHGLRYFTYLTQELSRYVRSVFPVSDKREDTFIAGLSMGGYGALKAALCQPEQYSAAASLSGAVDIGLIGKYASTDQERQMFEDVFGDPKAAAGGPDDLMHIAGEAAASGKMLPRLYLACGTEDELCRPMNQTLRKWLDELGLAYTYEEGPGAHEWNFWDQYIRRALAFMLPEGR